MITDERIEDLAKNLAQADENRAVLAAIEKSVRTIKDIVLWSMILTLASLAVYATYVITR